MFFLQIIQQFIEAVLPSRCLVCDRRIYGSVLCTLCTPHSKQTTHRCYRCGIDLENFNQLCEHCRLYPSPIRSIVSLWSYQDVAAELIRAIKYRPSLKLARLVAQRFVPALINQFNSPDWDLVVPIAASRSGSQRRGFDQGVIFGLQAAKSVAIRCEYKALKLNRRRLAQSSLAPKERARNSRNAFKANPTLVKGKVVLLIDDVLTTGATSTAATLALLEAGAFAVDLACLARSPRWETYRVSTKRH